MNEEIKKILIDSGHFNELDFSSNIGNGDAVIEELSTLIQKSNREAIMKEQLKPLTMTEAVELSKDMEKEGERIKRQIQKEAVRGFVGYYLHIGGGESGMFKAMEEYLSYLSSIGKEER